MKKTAGFITGIALSWLAACSAGAQTLTLLAVQAGMPATTVNSAPATRGPDAVSITFLARVIAAEAGGDYYSSLTAKTAVGSAVVNHIHKGYGIQTVNASAISLLEHHEPGYLSSAHDGNRGFYSRDAAWFRSHGYADCLTAAHNALSGQDASRGATNWYDNSIRQPYSSSKIVVTGHVKTAGSTLVFYRFR